MLGKDQSGSPNLGDNLHARNYLKISKVQVITHIWVKKNVLGIRPQMLKICISTND